MNDFSGTSWQVNKVLSDADYQWQVQAYDGALTSGWSGSRTVKIDATPPTISISSGPQGDVGNPSQTFSWAGSNNRTPTGSLVYSYRLRGLSDSWTDTSNTSVMFSGLSDGAYTFEVKSRDLVGNESSVASQSFYDDLTPPTTTIVSGPSGCTATSSITFTWAGSDNHTPTNQLQFSYWLEGFDSGWSSYGSATSKSYSALPDGHYTFHVRARDDVGNVDGSPPTHALTVDTTQPTGSVLIDGGATVANQVAVHLDVGADDGPVGCGLASMRLANDDQNYTDWQPVSTSMGWYLPPVDNTTWTVHLQLKDLAGNVSPAFTDSILLDLYPLQPTSANYELGAHVIGSADGGTSNSASYGLQSATLGQPLADGGMDGNQYHMDGGFQGAWPSIPKGRPPSPHYSELQSVIGASGTTASSADYGLIGAGGQFLDAGETMSQHYYLVSGFLGFMPTPNDLPTSETVTQGWNLIALPLQSASLASASGLAGSLNGSLGPSDITAVATYTSGRFSMYVAGYSADEALSPTQGVFVLSTKAGTWRWPTGSGFTTAQPLSLAGGWNLVAMPYPVYGLTTDTIASEIGSSKISEIAMFANGTYKTWTPTQGAGSAFLVPAFSGVWIECTTATTWTPQ